MTTDNKLAKQVRLLAELSGVKPYQHETNPARPDEWVWAYYDATEVNAKMLPAASGHVELSEVGLLLGWLAKAGIEIAIENDFGSRDDMGVGLDNGVGTKPGHAIYGYKRANTLELALENAILALDLEKNDD